MRKIFIACLFLHGCIAHAQSHYPGQHAGKFVLEDKLKPAVYSFDLQDVKLLESRFTKKIGKGKCNG